MRNYKTIDLPDCCAICRFIDQHFIDPDYPICMVSTPKGYKKVELNGVCSKFEKKQK